jgi:hypothetical protein
MRWACLVFAGACGRCGFDGAMTDTPRADINLAFVTSTTHVPSTFGDDLAGADAICADAAQSVGLPGRYIAFVSSPTVPARARLGNARGWQRVDGAPLFDLPDDITTGRIYYPLMMDEHGHTIATNVITGTAGNGDMASTCTGTGAIEIGSSTATSGDWLDAGQLPCVMERPIYCFGVDKSQPLVVSPQPGRRAFLSTQGYNADASGPAKADLLCATEAQAIGLSGTFKALLPTHAQSAFARAGLSIAGANWVRLDGVPLAGSPLAFAAGELATPLNLNSSGVYTGRRYVAAGGAGPSDTQTGYNCDDWTNPTSTYFPGVANELRLAWFYAPSNQPTPCAISSSVYCVEL